MKVDLVMWTKNGEEHLAEVLERIDNVIPCEHVHRKILVDDGSTDKTVEIAKSFGWETYLNPKGGISSGANEALSHVDCDYFASFEQDLLLAREWWQKIPPYLSDSKVAIASGIRICKGSAFGLETFSKVEEFAFERYRKGQDTGGFDLDKFLYGKTIDNTIYKTAVMRKLGGFPKLEATAGVDNLLAYQVHLAGYKWIVDYSVRSDHLRKSFREELNHRFWYGTCADAISKAFGLPYASLKRQILRLCFSPIRGFQVGITKRDLKATYVYPLIRFYVIRGIVHSRKGKT